MWKKIRIAILLLILASVALATWRGQRAAQDWDHTIQIAIFPINGDGRDSTAAHIAGLRDEQFQDIETFLTEEAARYGIRNPRPVRVTLQPELKTPPPPAPVVHSGLDVVLWSLKLRWWAWRQPAGVPRATIRAFVIYWDSSYTEGHVPNSHGLAKGQIAISNVHILRRMQRTNNVVITHEILHAMGASDKYDFADLMPRYPDGFAEPDAQPRYPQRLCELMAGRIPLSEQKTEMPYSLKDCVIGPASAQEIGLKSGKGD